MSTISISTLHRPYFIQPVTLEFDVSTLNSLFWLLWHLFTLKWRPTSLHDTSLYSRPAIPTIPNAIKSHPILHQRPPLTLHYSVNPLDPAERTIPGRPAHFTTRFQGWGPKIVFLHTLWLPLTFFLRGEPCSDLHVSVTCFIHLLFIFSLFLISTFVILSLLFICLTS